MRIWRRRRNYLWTLSAWDFFGQLVFCVGSSCRLVQLNGCSVKAPCAKPVLALAFLPNLIEKTLSMIGQDRRDFEPETEFEETCP